MEVMKITATISIVSFIIFWLFLIPYLSDFWWEKFINTSQKKEETLYLKLHFLSLYLSISFGIIFFLSFIAFILSIIWGW